MMTSGMYSSVTDNWATPQDLFDRLNAEFHLTLDVCADESNHKCANYFTKEQDGLLCKWGGRIWCNPPYGREIGKWVKRCRDSVTSGETEIAVMLLPARTDTRWFHDYIYEQADVRFIKGRLKFGNSKNYAPFPSMVVIFR